MKKQIRKVTSVLICSLMLALSVLGDSSYVIAASASVTASANNRDNFAMALYDALLDRKMNVTISYIGKNAAWIYNNFDQVLFQDVAALDDTSTTDDHDYLIGNIASYRCSYSQSGNEAIFRLKFTYHETLEETKVVNTWVSKTIKKLGLSNKQSYEKAKIIHDYIIKQVAYDNEFRYYSAFGGVQKGTTVCNGYALLAYKLFQEANIPCKYITGKAYTGGKWGAHAWNIIKIGGKWYNIDVTWDDPDLGNAVSYQYFMIGSTKFGKDHKRESYYTTDKFKKKYPTSSKSFKEEKLSKQDVSINIAKGTLKVKATVVVKPVTPKGKKGQVASIAYDSNKKSVATVSKSGKVTAKKAGKAIVKTTVKLVTGEKKVLETVITVK